MPREMLADRQNAATLQPTGIGHHLTSHFHRILSERARIDDRIFRIDIHIGHRSEIDLHPYLTALPSHLTPVFIQQTIVADTAQHHVARKRRNLLQTHAQSPFSVKSHQQGDSGHLLGLVGQNRLILHLPARKEQSAHLILPHHLAQQVAVRLVRLRSYGINEQLPDTLFQTQATHHRVYPLSARFVALQRFHQHRHLMRQRQRVNRQEPALRSEHRRQSTQGQQTPFAPTGFPFFPHHKSSSFTKLLKINS